MATRTVTPEELYSGIVSVESSGNPNAVSPKGAIGLTQIMPSTAARYGYRPEQLKNPGVQWDIYQKEMGRLLKKYDGDATKAVAAWNAGDRNIDRGRIPAETSAYVPKVLARTPGAGSMAQYKYSASTNTYWMTGPAGTPIQVPADQVPADIRQKAEARFGARAAAGGGMVNRLKAAGSALMGGGGAPAAAPSAAAETASIPSVIPPWMGTRMDGAAALPSRVPTTPPPFSPGPPTAEETPAAVMAGRRGISRESQTGEDPRDVMATEPLSFMQRFNQRLQAIRPEDLIFGQRGQGSPEEQYERRVSQLPGPAKYVVPQTLGELTATTARAAGPETGGLSLAIPAGMGAVTGYLEPGTGPTSPPWVSWPRAKRAGIEAGKEVLGQALTRAATGIVSKGAELAGRYTAVPEMIARTTARIGKGVEDLFNRFPLKKGSLQTFDDITEQISNGRLKEAAGDSIDELRDQIQAKIKPYVPGKAAPLQLHGPSGVPGTGVKFMLPDVDEANNTLVMREFNSVEEAFNHIKKMNNTGFGKTGAKGGSSSWLYREASHKGRDIMKGDLNNLGKPWGLRWGDDYASRNADYGTAVIMEKTFKGTTRTERIRGENVGVLDQDSLRDKIAKEMPNLRTLHPNDKPDAFQRAVAPKLGGATPGSFAESARGGLWDRLLDLLGAPYMPETRAVMPQPYRALSSPTFRRVAPAIATTPTVAGLSDLWNAALGSGQPEEAGR